MTRKTAKSYLAVFEYIERNLFALGPKEFMTDFEDGMRLAIKKHWPNVVIRGCWFHLCRAIDNKTRALGMVKMLKSHQDARMLKKQLMSLPLLPADQIIEGYKAIKKMAKQCKMLKKLKSLFIYFENYWLKQVGSLPFVFRDSFVFK